MFHSIKLQVSHIMVLSMVSSIRLLVNILRVLGQNILNLLVSSIRSLVLLVGSIRLLVSIYRFLGKNILELLIGSVISWLCLRKFMIITKSPNNYCFNAYP